MVGTGAASVPRAGVIYRGARLALGRTRKVWHVDVVALRARSPRLQQQQHPGRLGFGFVYSPGSGDRDNAVSRGNPLALRRARERASSVPVGRARPPGVTRPASRCPAAASSHVLRGMLRVVCVVWCAAAAARARRTRTPDILL